MAEYDLFIDDPKALPEGVETELLIRDTKTYETRRVRAILSSRPEDLPDADLLWLRYQKGGVRPRPWAIKILHVCDSLF